MSSMAAAALGYTLLISLRRRDEEKERERLRYVFVVLREKVRAVRRVWDIEGILFEYVCEHRRKATVQEGMFC